MGLPKDEINAAMRVYLGGGDQDAVYQPQGKEERLRKAYGPEWKALRKELDEYLDVIANVQVNWEELSVPEAAAQVERLVETAFPFFDETVRSKLASFFAYEWK